MKYIDADKLKAEIKRQQRRLMVLSNTEQVDMRRDCALQNGVYNSILSFITSLQQEQPEVDSLIRCELPDMEDDKSLGLCYCNQFGNHRMTVRDVQEIARHFYELGLKARKEE